MKINKLGNSTCGNNNIQNRLYTACVPTAYPHTKDINSLLQLQKSKQSRNQLSNQSNSQVAPAIITPYFSKSMHKLKGIVEMQQLPLQIHNEKKRVIQQTKQSAKQPTLRINSAHQQLPHNQQSQRQNKQQNTQFQTQQHPIALNMNNKVVRNTQPQINEAQLEKLKHDLLAQYQNFEKQHEKLVDRYASKYISPSNNRTSIKQSNVNQERKADKTNSSQQKTNRKQEFLRLNIDSPSQNFSPEGTVKRKSTHPDHNFTDDYDYVDGTPRVHRTLDSCLDDDLQVSNPNQETIYSINERKTDIKKQIDQQNVINDLGSFAFNPAMIHRQSSKQQVIEVLNQQDNFSQGNNTNSQENLLIQNLNFDFTQMHQNAFKTMAINDKPSQQLFSPPDSSQQTSLFQQFGQASQNETYHHIKKQNTNVLKFDISNLESFPSNIYSPLSQSSQCGGRMNSYNTVIHNENQSQVQRQVNYPRNNNNIQIINDSQQNQYQQFLDNHNSSRNQSAQYRSQNINNQNQYFSKIIESEAQKFFQLKKQQQQQQQLNETDQFNSFNSSHSNDDQDDEYDEDEIDESNPLFKSKNIESLCGHTNEFNLFDDEQCCSLPSSAQTSNFKIQQTVDQQIQKLNNQKDQKSRNIGNDKQIFELDSKRDDFMLIDGIASQGFQYQTFSENPNNKLKQNYCDLDYSNTLPVTLMRQQSNSRISQGTLQNMLRNSQKEFQSQKNHVTLDQSKATPAFKKALKEKFNQIYSNATSNSLSSQEGKNDWRYSNTSNTQKKERISEPQMFDASQMLDSVLETSEGVNSHRQIPETRQIVKKAPLDNVSPIFQKGIIKKVLQKQIKNQRKKSQVIIKQDEIKKNVYHLIGQPVEKKISNKKSKIPLQKKSSSQNMRVSTQPVQNRQSLIKAKRDQHMLQVNRYEVGDMSSQVMSNYNQPQSTKRLTTQNMSSNKDNSNYGILGNDMMLHSIMITQNPTKDSYMLTQNIYHPSESNPTMIRKETSSCSYCSECEDEEDDDEDLSRLSSSQSIIQPQTTHSNMQSQQAFIQTMFSQNNKNQGSQPGSNPRSSINHLHQLSMERLNENQINEGVVYQSNGFGLPNPYFVFNKSFQNNHITSSMATTSASLTSQNQINEHRKMILQKQRMSNLTQTQLSACTQSRQVSRNPSNNGSQQSLQLNGFLGNSHQNLMFGSHNGSIQNVNDRIQSLAHSHNTLHPRKISPHELQSFYQSQNLALNGNYLTSKAVELYEKERSASRINFRSCDRQMFENSSKVKYRPSLTQNDLRKQQKHHQVEQVRISNPGIYSTQMSNEFRQGQLVKFSDPQAYNNQYSIINNSANIMNQKLRNSNGNPNFLNNLQFANNNYYSRSNQQSRDNSQNKYRQRVNPTAGQHKMVLQKQYILNQITENNQTDSSDLQNHQIKAKIDHSIGNSNGQISMKKSRNRQDKISKTHKDLETTQHKQPELVKEQKNCQIF
ncbi:UNKNOWN [Stylonychia lemnae]|uniref:Uncharacterized protein n=1 Tax=Stylonychia lemnae TaxID=5949 RepID=A0A078AWN2_STYLE|nr:UNKNOWN [Stylonychia lemnae]|eukprot:CDW86865.1 UNKNOWN [Stylonychia lemnae]